MTKVSKCKCTAVTHKLLKEKAKTEKAKALVQELKGMVTNNIQIAGMEGRTADLGILGMHQMLGRCDAELNGPFPALLCIYVKSFSGDLARLSKQQCDEKDDAESPLKDLPQPNLEGPEPEGFIVSSKGPPEDLFPDFEFPEVDVVQHVMPDICPPASSFKLPKCALWDCSRPVQVWCQDYCSSDHAFVAKNEGLPGKTPVLRPGGIALKDGALFDALNAKTQGKDVGIPKCDGATQSSPWKDSKRFDLSLLEGEMLREWLFFDTPRTAFDMGNKKQRSLLDHKGRGWHESRKRLMKEYGGQKRSYYVDPQPSRDHEWHLYEYEANNSDDCALYRLELKFGTAKKSSKGKQSNDQLDDLQKKMGRLNADASTSRKNADAANIFGSDNQTTPTTYTPR